MKHFTEDNTQGYSNDELEKMNAEMDRRIEENQKNGCGYDQQIYKHWYDEILDHYEEYII